MAKGIVRNGGARHDEVGKGAIDGGPCPDCCFRMVRREIEPQGFSNEFVAEALVNDFSFSLQPRGIICTCSKLSII
jgi:hypothetical protein